MSRPWSLCTPQDARRSGQQMLANLTGPTGSDAMDRIINGPSKVAPKA
ncbi:hypothetical protein ABT354_25220 [Streptomyces sp. NPDC000594]